ncbi:Gfo/Idh/MocA family oxidoreductase [Mesorhizobium sp. M2C.T.Ca.TU.002.02.1.1]|uniref:Gfo/Idh/MocA family protein n=1 Tax=Mesorhizobium sp. M2C.T.Ca.TU.002.02.1.1 TaxID=2496788 RepID=UPI000FC99A66|nr:Gfo/Idh/MocA family oxidoreductase [Mesorhizobium sp. M2C.T.Ca.TU.002.02.1.1]RUU54274.1 Gfo/Idh/MocA family oxidoreductase [Mesorhizobium sp. M2C.T.Ca.TU.002.02.1.1]
MKKLKVAVLGTGMIVRRAHLPALLGDARVEVAAIYGRSRETAGELAAEFGIPAVAETIEDAVNVDGLNAVAVALPNFLHRQAAEAAIKARLHILMEKPLATSLDDARAMVHGAATAGIGFAVNLPQRHRPSMRFIRDAIEAGRIGNVQTVEVRMLRRAGIPGFGTWFTRKQTAGGGVLADLGPHVIDLALWLSGSASAAVTESRIWRSFGPLGKGLGDWSPHQPVEASATQFDVEDRASVSLRSDKGVEIRCDVAWAYAGSDENRVRVIGDKGGLDYWPEANGDLEPLRYFDADLNSRSMAVAGDHADLTPAWKLCVASFIDDIGSGRPLPRGDDALAVHEIIDRVYQRSRVD